MSCTCDQISLDTDASPRARPKLRPLLPLLDPTRHWLLPAPGLLITPPLPNNNTETSAHPDHFFLQKEEFIAGWVHV